MSFDKYMGKEKRKPYRHAKAVDGQCRNHGSCPWCKNQRLFNSYRERERIYNQIQEELGE